jgi:DNA-binding transcriptional regulator LsrR (DeoR family)
VNDEARRLLADLETHSARRRAARETDRQELAAIANLLPRAIQLGVTKREIARRTGLSRVTIDGLLRRQAG